MRLTFEGFGQVTEVRKLEKDGRQFGTSVKVAHGTGVIDLSLDKDTRLKLPDGGQWIQFVGKIEPDYKGTIRFKPSNLAVMTPDQMVAEFTKIAKASAA